jgi:choline kinase
VRATILAAGVGSRLRPLTNSVPKCLVPVAGRPVLGWQIDALRQAGVAPIAVVAGYRAGDVVDFCRQYGDSVSVIINAAYDRTNNMFSLRLALDGHQDEPATICNGDVVFDAAIVSAMVDAAGPDLIAVEPGRYIEESMKVSVDGQGRITQISKAIARDAAHGVSIDLYRFSGAGIEKLYRTALRMIDEAGSRNLWTEVAIDAILRDVAVRPHDIAGRRWIEIDNFDDLAEGERLFSPAAP